MTLCLMMRITNMIMQDLAEAVDRLINYQRVTDAAYPERCKEALDWLNQVASGTRVQVYQDCESKLWVAE